MTKTIIVKASGHRLFKLAMVPAVLLALASLANAPKAVANDAAANAAGCQSVGFGCKAMEGTWLYTVSIPVSGSSPLVFQGTETYAAGGGYVEADQLSVTPNYLATAGHGAWQETDGHFLLTYVNFTYGADGATGSSKVRQSMWLTDGGMKYRGYGDFFYYGSAGEVVQSGTFTVTATRVTVETPAE